MNFDAYAGGFLINKKGVYKVDLDVTLESQVEVNSAIVPGPWPTGSTAFKVDFETVRRDLSGNGTVETSSCSKFITSDVPLAHAPYFSNCSFSTILESNETLGLLDLLNVKIKALRDEVNQPFVPSVRFLVKSNLTVSRIKA